MDCAFQCLGHWGLASKVKVSIAPSISVGYQPPDVAVVVLLVYTKPTGHYRMSHRRTLGRYSLILFVVVMLRIPPGSGALSISAPALSLSLAILRYPANTTPSTPIASPHPSTRLLYCEVGPSALPLTNILQQNGRQWSE